MALEAIAWKYRTCSPWRDVPGELGPFQTAHKRLVRWAVDGTWERILAAVPVEADAVDDVGWTGSVDSNRLPGSPAFGRSPKKGEPGRSEPDDHALGRSRGGLSTKVHLAREGQARPLAIHVTAGQAGDAPVFEAVMARIRTYLTRRAHIVDSFCAGTLSQPPKAASETPHSTSRKSSAPMSQSRPRPQRPLHTHPPHTGR